jgi:hypothetical protein
VPRSDKTQIGRNKPTASKRLLAIRQRLCSARPPDRNRIIGVNGYLVDLTAPFGGIKNSRVGREFGPAGLANYQQLKTSHLH